MARNIAAKQFYNDSKRLAISIYDFLLDECEKNKYSLKSKTEIEKAADCIEKVYKIGFFSYVMSDDIYSLEYIFTFGRRPIPVKNRIAGESHKRKGNHFMDQGMFKYAEMEYTKAIKLDPINAIYFCNRAASRIHQRLLADAVTDCKKALELDKHYVKAYCWLGLANVLMNHPGKAVRCYRRALRIEPRNSVCIENMDLINKNLNHRVLRVFEPVYRFTHTFVRKAKSMMKKQTLPRRKSDGDHADEATPGKKPNYQIEKFKLEKLD